jgi:hypothetical protein
VKAFSVNVTTRAGDGTISANVPGFRIGLSRGRRIASSESANQPRLSLAALPV